MDYAILDDLMEQTESRKEDYQNKHNCYFVSRIEEVTEPFNGSSEQIRLYIFKNYIAKTGLMNLAVIIRESADKKGNKNGFKVNNVEVAIYPLYSTSENSFEIPPTPEPPDIFPDDQKFIIAKRSLPKAPKGEAEKVENRKNYKWTINMIAEELHISNRTVALYCRAKNI